MPSAATGETLAERAQRFLGIDLDTWLSTELKSDHQTTQANRSEQIAHAQRKHRQRTQSYIQALEEEVLRLRGVELALKGELEKFREQSQPILEDSYEKRTNAPNTEGQNHSWNDTITPESIVIGWNELYQTTAELPCCVTAAEATPPEIPWIVAKDHVSPDQPHPVMWADAFADVALPQTTSSLPEVVKDVELEIGETPLNLEMGVKYILQLERPCLSHLKHAIQLEPRREGYLDAPYNWGTNHAYNLSTRLFHEHTSLSTPEEAHITSFDLDNLLQASERLQLADEFTPVQVWALIRKLDTMNRIDPVVVTAMLDELSNYSYCNSFGSAISKATLRAAFQHFLGWSHEL